MLSYRVLWRDGFWSVVRMLLEKISLTSTQVSEVGWARLALFTVIGQLPRGRRM